jgi:hypothetical protein
MLLSIIGMQYVEMNLLLNHLRLYDKKGHTQILTGVEKTTIIVNHVT